MKMTMQNLPAEAKIKTWVIASRKADGTLEFFYTTDDVTEAASILEWYGAEVVMVHKTAVVMTALEKAMRK